MIPLALTAATALFTLINTLVEKYGSNRVHPQLRMPTVKKLNGKILDRLTNYEIKRQARRA